jgi:hypothetical protein
MSESEKFEAAEIHLAKVATLLDAVQEAAESPIRSELDLHQTTARLHDLLAQASARVDAAALS